MSFEAKLSVLPEPQRLLWPELKSLSGRFVLYGGTGLALRLGHRQSEDFDLFTDAPLDVDVLLQQVALLKNAVVRQKSANSLTVTLGHPQPVKLSFFGLALRRVRDPEWTQDGVIRVASLLDLAACKMAVVQARAESKDYFDVAALLESGVSLAEALGAAQAVYGTQFNPMITLKALSYFGDGDLGALPDRVRHLLLSATAATAQLVEFHALPGGIVPAENM